MDQDKIIVHKLNESNLKIECEDGVAHEIQEHFTFYAPGYRWHPKFKQKMWDGKIKLLNLKTRQLYYGLLSNLETFAQTNNYPIEINFENFGNELSLIEAVNYINEINPKLPDNEETRDYQIKAFVDAIRYKRCVLLSPTASGKSLIMFLIARYLIERGIKILVVVPTINLVEQLYSDFEAYSINNKWNVEKNCHRIYQGKDKDVDKPITISTWQSIYNMEKEWFEKYSAILGDEADGFKATSLITIMNNLVNCSYRIGLTGTTNDVKVHNLVLEGLFGKFIKVASTKELMDKGHLAPLLIKALLLRHPEELCKSMGKLSMDEEWNYLVNSKSRNKFIKNLALSLDKNTLILFRFVEHGKNLYDEINNNGKKCFFIYGKTDIEIRESIRKILETETNAILIASLGVFSRGSNVRNLHNLIMASPTKSKVRNLQSIGRLLRKFEEKEATLFDIGDDMRYGKRENITLKHYMDRLKIYMKEKFTIKQYKIQLKG